MADPVGEREQKGGYDESHEHTRPPFEVVVRFAVDVHKGLEELDGGNGGNRNSQAVGYLAMARMSWFCRAARALRMLAPCFLAVETTDLRRAKV